MGTLVSYSVLLKALVLAGPVLFYPFSRSYYAFYVFILAWALVQEGARGLWRQAALPRVALLALVLPVLMTTLAWLPRGGDPGEWLGKAGVMLLGALLGLATVALSRDDRVARYAGIALTVAVGSWIADGLLQLLTGHSLDCRGDLSACVTDDRISLYFATKSKMGYVMGLLLFLPVAWLVSQRRVAAALGLLFAGGLVAFAGASRFTMLSWLVGGAALAAVLLAQAPLARGSKLALAAGAPLLVLVLAAVLYQVNTTFQSRVDASLLIVSGLDYATVNRGLSGRLDIWGPLLQMLREHWLFGVGPGTLDAGIRPYIEPGNIFWSIKIFHAHQVVLDVAAATGVIGLAAFVGLYGWVLLHFLRASRAGVDLRWAGLLVFLLMWFPLNSPNGFYSSEMLLMTFYMLGLGAGFRDAGAPRPVVTV